MGLPAEKIREVVTSPGLKGEEPFYRKPPKLRGIGYYLRCKIRKSPILLNIEFTKLCNAKCFFCHCWQVESPNELQDYGPVVKRFRPVVCSVSGGEPLLRKNYAELLTGIRPWCHYLNIITNGARLTEEVARELRRVGVDHISISLDYNSSKHDEVRKIEGLYNHISTLVPKLTAKGYSININTIIMESNLKDVLELAEKSREWGAGFGVSSFCSLKANEESEMVHKDRLQEVRNLIQELKGIKKKYKHLKSSDYYLDQIPDYFKKGWIGGCKAGHTFIQITPDGYVQRCAEMPRMAHYSEYWPTNVGRTECTKCWYSCRGETEAPIFSPKRFFEILRS